MYRNHFKIAWRSALKNRSYTAINLLGLATGIACFGIIALYVHNELTYDKFHKDSDRIYRVAVDQKQTDGSYTANLRVVTALAPSMVREIPEVVAGTWFRSLPWAKAKLTVGDETIFNDKVIYTDSTFFDVFSFSFIEGNPQTALLDPASIVLTKSLARAIFGNEKAVGRTLNYTHGRKVNSLTGGGRSLKVTGVIEDVPIQSHFSFDMLVPFRAVEDLEISWKGHIFYTYFKTVPDPSLPELESKIQALADANIEENKGKYSVQPLTGMKGIHLTSHRIQELDANSHSLYIKALLIVAFFVIIIAGVNYINLSTARSSMRAKEIGVRKVTGAQRHNLITQFLSESVFISLLSGIIAIGLIQIALPFLNALIEKKLTLFTEFSQPIWLLIGVVVLGIGVLAGLYPAFFLSSFKPIHAIKNGLTSSTKGLSLRRTLVVFQFSLAVLLTIGVLVVQQQIRFIQNADLGFKQDRVIQIENRNPDRKYVLRNTIRETPGVLNISSSRNKIGLMDNTTMEPVKLVGGENELPVLWRSYIDEHYFDVFDIQVVAGRNFVPDLDKTDRNVSNACILNEKVVKGFGMTNEEIIGHKLAMVKYGKIFTVVGVVKDFHPGSLHHEVKPLGFAYSHVADGELAVKLAGGDMSETISRIEETWAELFPNKAPMDFYFLDDAIDKQYRSEQNFRTIFSIMTGLSIVIACLGIFGLAAFMAEKRMKEIGIRKVLGASIRNLLGLMTKEYIYLILVANLIAWPIAYFAMGTWLESFAYRISIGPDSFVVSGALVMIIAISVVSALVYKTAITNPVDSLRDE